MLIIISRSIACSRSDVPRPANQLICIIIRNTSMFETHILLNIENDRFNWDKQAYGVLTVFAAFSGSPTGSIWRSWTQDHGRCR